MTAEVDVNGGAEVPSPKDLYNGHASANATADGPYVFVNPNDVVSGDPVHTDLNSISNSTVELINKPSRPNHEDEKIESSEIKESLIIVNPENDPSGSRSEDQGVTVDCNLEADAELGMPSVNHQPQDTVPVSYLVDSNDGAPQLNESSENTKILPFPLDTAADLPVNTNLADPLGELGDDFKQNREATDIRLETLVVSGPVTHQTEQRIGHAQEAVLGNDQETPQLDNTSESALPSPVDSKDLHVESSQSLLHDPVSIGETSSEPDFGLGALTVADSRPSAGTENSDDSTIVDNEIENEVQNVAVGTDIALSCLSNGSSDHVRQETETIERMDSEGKVTTLTTDNSNLKSKVLKGVTVCVDSLSTPAGNAPKDSVENESSLGADVKAGSKIENRSVVSCINMPVGEVSEPDVLFESISVPDIVGAEPSITCSTDVGHVENGGIQPEVEGTREIQFTGEIDDKTCQAVKENGGIQFAQFGESDDKTCPRVEEDGIQACQEVEEDGGSQFTGAHTTDKLCQGVEENGKAQFAGGESADKECEEMDESEEVDEVYEVVEIELSGDKASEEVDEIGDIAEIELSDDKACEEVDEIEIDEIAKIEFTREDSGDKASQEVEENREIQFSGETDDTDDRACQGEESDDKACQEVEENGEIKFTGETDDKACQDVEENGIVHKSYQEKDGSNRNDTLASSPECSTVDASETQNVVAEVVKRPFYFLIKVPRYDDENLREQIKSAQAKVDEKTQSRDVIRAEIQMLRDTYKKYGDNIEATMVEEKVARELLKSKRQEIDSLQSMINKVKNAISVEDIDGRIRNMEHMIAHETLPLKEEKQFIRDIKQLKQLREQFSFSMGKQDELQQAFDQKDQIEERLKLLRKQAESLRENVVKAEAATQGAKKKQKDESEKLRKLYAEFKVADDIRQESYKHLQSLRKQAYDKNKHFWKYKDDVKQANDFLSKGDKEALQHLCVNQVERVLELWNNNNEFRKEYVNSNIRSTLRRLRTFDGRSLGPDEAPPVIRSFVNNRVTNDNSVSQISTLREEKSEQVLFINSEKVDDKPIATVEEKKNQTAKSKRPAKAAVSANGLATVSGRNELEEARDERPKGTKEDEEFARKAEELRKEEEAAKLKEQRRFEEKIKAKEALERKKKIAEKAQARAILRAQKEAEHKEKEREKRARKKEKRKAATTEDSDIMTEEESAPITDTSVELPQSSEITEKSVTVSKRPKKPSQLTKQNKAKSIPPLPIRNRGKRKMQTWTWVLIIPLVVIALFLLGNSRFPSQFGLQGFGF